MKNLKYVILSSRFAALDKRLRSVHCVTTLSKYSNDQIC